MAEGDTAKTDQSTSQTTTSGQQTNSISRLVKRFFRRVYKILSSTLGLVIALVLYSFMGASVFHVIEGRNESTVKTNILEVRDDVINNTLNLTLTFNQETQQTELAEGLRIEMKKFEDKLHEVFLGGINSDSELRVWDFWGSFLFCATIYTTIGMY
jgi:hypothetical protein